VNTNSAVLTCGFDSTRPEKLYFFNRAAHGPNKLKQDIVSSFFSKVGIHRANFADNVPIGFTKLLFIVASLYWIYPLKG
jgi:hypothetical protein